MIMHTIIKHAKTAWSRSELAPDELTNTAKQPNKFYLKKKTERAVPNIVENMK